MTEPLSSYISFLRLPQHLVLIMISAGSLFSPDDYLSDEYSRFAVLVHGHHFSTLVLYIFKLLEERVAVSAENQVDTFCSLDKFLVGDEVRIVCPA